MPIPTIETLFQLSASIAQAVERILGKNEVMGSSPIGGSRNTLDVIIRSK